MAAIRCASSLVSSSLTKCDGVRRTARSRRLILRSSRTAAKRLPGGVGRENGEAAFVADDGLAVDQARAHRQHCQGGDDLREAAREVIAIGPSSLQRLIIFVAIGGRADIPSGRSKCRR